MNSIPSNEESENTPLSEPVENHQPTTSSSSTDPHQLSSLELENKLLKNEVASLNQEMASALDRAKKAQTGRFNSPQCPPNNAIFFIILTPVLLQDQK